MQNPPFCYTRIMLQDMIVIQSYKMHTHISKPNSILKINLITICLNQYFTKGFMGNINKC